MVLTVVALAYIYVKRSTIHTAWTLFLAH